MSEPAKTVMVAELKIERLVLADLREHERNPRKHPEKGTSEWMALARSLAHDYFDPIVHNARNGKLVSGHLRRKVLIELGFTHADCSVVDYDEPTHIARMIAANRQTGEFDIPAMKDLLMEIDTGAMEMSLAGFTVPDLEDLMTAAMPEVEGPAHSCPDCGAIHQIRASK